LTGRFFETGHCQLRQAIRFCRSLPAVRIPSDYPPLLVRAAYQFNHQK